MKEMMMSGLNRFFCISESKMKGDGQISEIAVDDLDVLLDEGAILVDVREEDEIDAAGTIEGSLVMPLSVFDEYKEEFPTDKPVILFCRSGRRSLRAADIASNWTSQPLYSLAGGYLAYVGDE
jgi:rhodanese-related sulfurtransferase